MAKKKSGKRVGKKTVIKTEPVSRHERTRVMLIAIVLLVSLALVLLLLQNGADDSAAGDLGGEQYRNLPKPVVTIEMENGALIKLELDPVNAPNSVRNFIALAEAGFYDGLTFHRVIPGFMIQGGCPEGTGRSGPGYSIRGEFAANGHENEIPHKRGVISMARTDAPNSAGSQFFITVADRPDLDGQYAAFGYVIEGMEEADRIAGVARDQADKPLEDQRMKRVSVEEFGVEYGPPVKL